MHVFYCCCLLKNKEKYHIGFVEKKKHLIKNYLLKIRSGLDILIYSSWQGLRYTGLIKEIVVTTNKTTSAGCLSCLRSQVFLMEKLETY